MMEDRGREPTGVSRRSLLLGAAAIGAGGSLLAGCGSSAAESGSAVEPLSGVPGFKGKDPNGKYYWIAHAGPGDPYWATVQRGAKEIAKILGVSVVFQGPPTYDPSKQASFVTAAATAGASGIITTAASAKTIAPAVKAAAEAGVPVMFSDTPPPANFPTEFVGGGRFGFVGTDIRAAAKDVAAKVAPKLSRGARVVIINHEPGNVVLEAKSAGYADGLASAHPTVDRLNIGDQQTRAVEILRGYYSKHPDLKAIFGLGAIGNHVAVSFAQDAHLLPDKVVIAGSDIDSFTTNALNKGDMEATIGIPSYLFGMLPVVLLYFYNAFALYPADYLQSAGDTITKALVPQVEALTKKGFR